jgi:hypothetical protein
LGFDGPDFQLKQKIEMSLIINLLILLPAIYISALAWLWYSFGLYSQTTTKGFTVGALLGSKLCSPCPRLTLGGLAIGADVLRAEWFMQSMWQKSKE